MVVCAADLLGGVTLEWWANAWLVLAGTTLLLAAVFVRMSIPGGLSLASPLWAQDARDPPDSSSIDLVTRCHEHMPIDPRIGASATEC